MEETRGLNGKKKGGGCTYIPYYLITSLFPKEAAF